MTTIIIIGLVAMIIFSLKQVYDKQNLEVEVKDLKKELTELKACKKDVKTKLTKAEHKIKELEEVIKTHTDNTQKVFDLEARKLALDTEIEVLRKRNIHIDELHTKCILESKKLKEQVSAEIENQNEIAKHVPKSKQVIPEVKRGPGRPKLKS